MIHRSKPKSILPYLLLNILVSALTTLTVLVVWTAMHPQPTLSSLPPQPELTPTPQVVIVSSGGNLAPADQPVMEISAVMGAGDLGQEAVILKRIGKGSVDLTGWRLQNQQKVIYTFAPTPKLVVFENGSVQIYTGAGTNTATTLYWNRNSPAWRPGDTLSLLDDQGVERARYKIP